MSNFDLSVVIITPTIERSNRIQIINPLIKFFIDPTILVSWYLEFVTVLIHSTYFSKGRYNVHSPYFFSLHPGEVLPFIQLTNLLLLIDFLIQITLFLVFNWQALSLQIIIIYLITIALAN